MSQDRVRVRGLSIHRPIIYGNSAQVMTPEERSMAPDGHTYKWTVAVRSAASAEGSGIVGGADDISHFIRRVSFKLHETYTNPLRNVEKPPFEVHETGWGEFEVQIKITFSVESGEKAIAFYHHLKLHPWNVDPIDPDVPEHPPSLQAAAAFGPVNSWQYDEVVFVDPFQAFLSILTQNPPTPLPRISSRPVPFHLANPTRAALEASKGGVPEFSQQMEREEASRLDEALKAVLEEQERWKAILDEREREVEELKVQLGEE